MSLDVFLSFRRCPKHPNTPTFDFGAAVALISYIRHYPAERLAPFEAHFDESR